MGPSATLGSLLYLSVTRKKTFPYYCPKSPFPSHSKFPYRSPSLNHEHSDFPKILNVGDVKPTLEFAAEEEPPRPSTQLGSGNKNGNASTDKSGSKEGNIRKKSKGLVDFFLLDISDN